MYNQRPQTSVLEDVEEFGAFGSQGYVPTSTEDNTTLLQMYLLSSHSDSKVRISLSLENTCNLCYSLVIAMNKDRQSSIKLK